MGLRLARRAATCTWPSPTACPITYARQAISIPSRDLFRNGLPAGTNKMRHGTPRPRSVVGIPAEGLGAPHPPTQSNKPRWYIKEAINYFRALSQRLPRASSPRKRGYFMYSPDFLHQDWTFRPGIHSKITMVQLQKANTYQTDEHLWRIRCMGEAKAKSENTLKLIHPHLAAGFASTPIFPRVKYWAAARNIFFLSFCSLKTHAL